MRFSCFRSDKFQPWQSFDGCTGHPETNITHLKLLDPWKSQNFMLLTRSSYKCTIPGCLKMRDSWRIFGCAPNRHPSPCHEKPLKVKTTNFNWPEIRTSPAITLTNTTSSPFRKKHAVKNPSSFLGPPKNCPTNIRGPMTQAVTAIRPCS